MKPALFVATCLIGAPVLAAEPTAGDYLTFFKPIIGEWNVTLRVGGDVSKGELSLSLPPTKACIIESARGFGPIPAFDGVSGFDPETRKWKSLFYNAKGECVTRYGGPAKSDSTHRTPESGVKAGGNLDDLKIRSEEKAKPEQP